MSKDLKLLEERVSPRPSPTLLEQLIFPPLPRAASSLHAPVLLLGVSSGCCNRGNEVGAGIGDCNKQNDSWACGYYIMSCIKAIIRAEIRGEWTEVEIYI
ncbi:hypothetical protein VIGAN_05219100 [Vigna angularis var. angularis]|uniref:Ubiquitin-like protease family profile domain-containing protein n=1 Tax=Vigna angularis var. angularis TaxID=157739 RepID=A0A0S3S728_PHAAN|nr:hypothetical protein VIGAN_05219100 [Vigna angularis var. angularis]